MLKEFLSKAGGFLSKTTTQIIPEDVLKKYQALMDEKISPIISLLPEDKACAQIARQSYETNRQIQIQSYILDEKHSTASATIYVDSEKKIAILGLRGTVAKEFRDLTSDIQIVLDIQGIDPRVKESLDMYDLVKREYPGYTIRVCGHSLGGTLSYIVAKHRNVARCIVFNPGVSINTFFIQMLEDTFKHKPRAENTYTYKIFGDIVSPAAFVGHTKVFRISATDPLKLHAMDNFI